MPEYREKMRYENNKGEQGRTVMETVMKEQDKRAVESMCRCGLDLEGVIAVFPRISKEDVAAVSLSVRAELPKRPLSGGNFSEKE